jgi:ribonuclease-3 family protein
MLFLFGEEKLERPGELPALVLAYVGDAVYELAVRSHLAGSGLVKVRRLHDEAVKYVNAGAQARVLRALEGRLTEEESMIVRRGRNAKSPHTPRSCDVIEYRHSTAFESLLGYLYLKGDTARLAEILALAGQVTGGKAPADRQEPQGR